MNYSAATGNFGTGARVAAVGSLAACLLPSPAAAGVPWIVQPSIGVSTEYQSNPAYDVANARRGYSESLSLSLPVSSEIGRHQFNLTANLQVHDAHGASEGNTSSYDIDGLWSRSSERGSVSLNGSSARSSLIGASSVDLGVSRGPGYRLNHSAGLAASWLLSERDRVGAKAGLSLERFNTPSSSGYFDGKFTTVAATYSRTLNPQLQVLLSVNAGRSESDDSARRSTNYGFQTGIDYRLNEIWSFTANGGRSSVRNTASGAANAGATYTFGASRQALLGAFSLTASRGLQASAFGTLVQQDDAALAYNTALSERLGIGAQLGWSALQDTFIGFDLSRREYRRVSVTLSYALAEAWSLSARTGYTRSVNPRSLLQRNSSAAESIDGSITLSYGFDPISVP